MSSDDIQIIDTTQLAYVIGGMASPNMGPGPGGGMQEQRNSSGGGGGGGGDGGGGGNPYALGGQMPSGGSFNSVNQYPQQR